MKRDRVYIIPTYYGFVYGMGIIVSLLAAAIYNNNLAYLLCFFLVALFVVGMHQSNSNLKKLWVEKARFELTPENGKGSGLIWLKSDNPEGHVKVRVHGTNQDDTLKSEIDYIHPKSLHANRVQLFTGQRGHKKFGKITISSRYPFGLFYVWRTFNLATDYYVYPKPVGHNPLPAAEIDGSTQVSHLSGKGDDFSGHKEYEIGESQKRIDWKAFARGRPLLVKEFDHGEFKKLVLSTAGLTGDYEDQLRQVAKWVFECERKQVTYAVNTGHSQSPFGHGGRQKEQALKLLATAGEN